MKKVTVLLVDDHPVVRDGLSALVGLEEDLEVIGEADNGRAAVALARKRLPEVVIMDLSMPLLNGAETTRQIHQAIPAVKVLVLSSYGDEESVERLMQAGAAGYLTKESAATELIQAIREVHRGKSFFSSDLARCGRQHSDDGCAGARLGAIKPRLTPRQTKVLQLIAEGFANKEIAMELGISIKTVEKQRQQVMKKLDVHETAGLTRYAIEQRLVGCTLNYG
jgi:two-component system, NarL family, nitrate/nitrite response regulator NarL